MAAAVPAVCLVACLAASGGVLAQQWCDPDALRLSATPERFEDNGDGTVTDRRLQLTWMRCSAPQRWSGGSCVGAAGILTWAEAQAFAADVNRRGSFFFNDWRVPQLRELATIIETHCANPRIHLGVFPGTPARQYWTASSRPGDGAQARVYALSFGPEGIALIDTQESRHVRLVRNTR